MKTLIAVTTAALLVASTAFASGPVARATAFYVAEGFTTAQVTQSHGVLTVTVEATFGPLVFSIPVNTKVFPIIAASPALTAKASAARPGISTAVGGDTEAQTEVSGHNGKDPTTSADNHGDGTGGHDGKGSHDGKGGHGDKAGKDGKDGNGKDHERG